MRFAMDVARKNPANSRADPFRFRRTTKERPRFKAAAFQGSAFTVHQDRPRAWGEGDGEGLPERSCRQSGAGAVVPESQCAQSGKAGGRRQRADIRLGCWRCRNASAPRQSKFRAPQKYSPRRHSQRSHRAASENLPPKLADRREQTRMAHAERQQKAGQRAAEEKEPSGPRSHKGSDQAGRIRDQLPPTPSVGTTTSSKAKKAGSTASCSRRGRRAWGQRGLLRPLCRCLFAFISASNSPARPRPAVHHHHSAQPTT